MRFGRGMLARIVVNLRLGASAIRSNDEDDLEEADAILNVVMDPFMDLLGDSRKFVPPHLRCGYRSGFLVRRGWRPFQASEPSTQ